MSFNLHEMSMTMHLLSEGDLDRIHNIGATAKIEKPDSAVGGYLIDIVEGERWRRKKPDREPEILTMPVWHPGELPMVLTTAHFLDSLSVKSEPFSRFTRELLRLAIDQSCVVLKMAAPHWSETEWNDTPIA